MTDLQWRRRLSCLERGLNVALGVAVVLIGTGRIESSFSTSTLSAWSTSRTTFFFWLVWKFLVWRRGGSTPKAIQPAVELLPLWLFLGAVTASVSTHLRDLSDYRYLLFAVMHCVMVLDLCRDPKRQRFLFLALGLAPALLLVRGVAAEPQVLDFSLAHRLAYPLDHANTVGFLLAMSFPLSFALASREKGGLRGLAIVSCCAQLVALLLTYSRGAWLGWMVAMFFFVLAAGARKEILLLGTCAILIVALVSPLQKRLGSFFDPSSDVAVNERLQIMRDSFRVGLNHPILGVGYGRGRLKAAIRSDSASVVSPRNPIWHAHNLYLELFAETGLAGLGTFLWLLGCALWGSLRAAWRARGNTRVFNLAIAASAIAFIFCCLSDVAFHHHETRLFFFTLLALMLLVARQTARETGSESC